MLGKVTFLILGMGVTGCVLLGYRQLRLQTLHELAEVQRRLNVHDRDLYRLRSAVAQRVAPARVAELAARMGPLVSVGVDDQPPPQAESFDSAAFDEDGEVPSSRTLARDPSPRPR